MTSGPPAEASSRWHLVQAADDIDMHSAPALRDLLLKGINEKHQHVVLDMTEVTFIDSSGFAVLVTALKRLRATGGNLRIAGVNSAVRSAMRISALDQIFDLYPDATAAMSDDPNPVSASPGRP